MSSLSLPTFVCAVGLAAFLHIANLPISPLIGLKTNSVQAQTQSIPLQEMTIERLEVILRDQVRNVRGNSERWQFTIEGQSMIVLTDTKYNRMRIVAPIMPTEELSTQQIQAMLVANFHSALDARYAVSNGTVVAIFVHPLNSLQENDFRSGLLQVANLANSFGTSYSSGGLGFFPNRESQQTVPSRERNIDI